MSDQEAERHLAEGHALLDLGRPESALAPFGQACALWPEEPEPRLGLAVALLELDRYGESLTAAEETVGLAPEWAAAHRVRALALRELDRNRDARQAALEAVRLEPDEAVGYVVLSEVLQRTGDEAGAIAAARHAVTLDPSDPDAHDTVGRLLLVQEDRAGAEAAFRTALRIDPEHAAAQNNLSLALGLRGARGRQEALAALEGAARSDPSDPVVQRNVLMATRGSRVAGSLLTGFGVVGGAVGLALLVTGATDAAHRVAALGWGAILLAFGVLLVLRGRRSQAGLSPALRAVHDDDWRARRLKPWRWDYSSLTRLRPWWWLLLQRLPPPAALLGNAVLVTTFPRILGVLALIGLPFSVLRTWRWFRRVRPGAGSWRSPGS